MGPWLSFAMKFLHVKQRIGAWSRASDRRPSWLSLGQAITSLSQLPDADLPQCGADLVGVALPVLAEGRLGLGLDGRRRGLLGRRRLERGRRLVLRRLAQHLPPPAAWLRERTRAPSYPVGDACPAAQHDRQEPGRRGRACL